MSPKQNLVLSRSEMLARAHIPQTIALTETKTGKNVSYAFLKTLQLKQIKLKVLLQGCCPSITMRPSGRQDVLTKVIGIGALISLLSNSDSKNLVRCSEPVLTQAEKMSGP